MNWFYGLRPEDRRWFIGTVIVLLLMWVAFLIGYTHGFSGCVAEARPTNFTNQILRSM